MFQNIEADWLLAMALSRSYVRCAMCQGNVSIVPGNLETMRMHLENQHDVFHQLDFFISINFLEGFEMEEIISKALPRMKVIFDGAKFPSSGRVQFINLNESKLQIKEIIN